MNKEWIIQLLFYGRFAEYKRAFWCGFLLFIILKLVADRLPWHLNWKKIDAMSGEDFEYYIAEMLIKHGFKNVNVTKTNGDFGVDVIGEYKKTKYAIQV